MPARWISDPDLTVTDMRLLGAIGTHTDARGTRCIASAATMAKEIEASERSVFRSLKRLEELGYIRRIRRLRDNGSDTSSEIQVLLDQSDSGVIPPYDKEQGGLTELGQTPYDSQVSDQITRAVNEHSTSSSSGLVPSEYEPDLNTLLERIAKTTPNASISSWIAEIRVATQGMHGPAITPEQVGEAIRGFNANGAPTNFKLFKSYLRKTEVAPKPEVIRSKSISPASNKKPWEIAKEREARDLTMNRDFDVHRAVNEAKELRGDEWWKKMISEAQEKDRWVVPYAFDILRGEENSGAA